MESYLNSLHEIEGIPFLKFFTGKSILEALKYHPRSDDLFIVSYPKTGSHWTQYIIYLMWNQGKPCKSFNEFKECASFLDLEGVRNLEDLKAPRMIMTHIPYEKCPKNEETKYIYVLRNPKDVIVSYYYFLNGILETPLDLDSAFELFLDGKLIYGDYFKDVKLWYEHRDDPNVLLVVYEKMKEDLEKSVMTIAKFLNIEEARKEDPEIMKKIFKYSSVEETKRVLEADTSLIDKAKGDILKPEMIPKTAKISFVRKGIIGDWKTHLSREQEERLNERTEKEFAGIDFYEYWKKLGIFRSSQ
ncbi:hypothetical protein LAZ67_6001700 [Cordylochernes scorpioides]|uniref:Sulfotransferase domain-containing protein n=1 Tax=Cordylochernes scorpioides TaxID=51811 RepID=A0ABY6KJA6_9ARAC|nr:hypothetical protein LAZ67_6001700 [Cordylochernes scorpioides]